MKQILLLEDLPEIRAWLKALALQVFPDAQISEASRIHDALELVNAGVLGQVPPAAGKMLNLAQQNTARLVALVNDILDLSKIEANKMEMTMETFDISTVLGDLMGMVRPLAVKNVTLEAGHA